jgi:hypothetical protein
MVCVSLSRLVSNIEITTSDFKKIYDDSVLETCVREFRRRPRERTFWCALEIASPCCRPKVTTYAYSTRNREISARLRYMPSSYTLTILGCCSSSRKNACSCKSCIQALHNRAVRPCVASRACNSWLQSTQSCWTGTMRMSVIDVYYE